MNARRMVLCVAVFGSVLAYGAYDLPRGLLDPKAPQVWGEPAGGLQVAAAPVCEQSRAAGPVLIRVSVRNVTDEPINFALWKDASTIERHKDVAVPEMEEVSLTARGRSTRAPSRSHLIVPGLTEIWVTDAAVDHDLTLPGKYRMIVGYTYRLPGTLESVNAAAPPFSFSVEPRLTTDGWAAVALYSSGSTEFTVQELATDVREYANVMGYVAASHPREPVRSAARRGLEKTRDEINRLLEGLPDAPR